MSVDESEMEPTGHGWRWLAAAAVGVVAVILSVYLLLGRSGAGAVQSAPGARLEENELEAARQALLKDDDLTTCQGALGQINTYLSQTGVRTPPVLAEDKGEALRLPFGLTKEDIDEISGSNYTRLDGHYLEQCLLLRDVARSIEVGGTSDAVKPTPLQQATTAFDWVVRQVRHQATPVQEALPSGIPPALVLRRGWGNSWDRALIFLALLEQVGNDGGRPPLQGCLLILPPLPGGKPRLWACGVAAEGARDLYLFDPRLGMALPGPGGKGVATLADARSRPEVLEQLNFDKERRYDVTAEQAKAADPYLVCSLSALAPRLRFLQEELLAPGVEVRLAADVPAALDRLKKAAAGGGKEPEVPVWADGVTTLRRFLGPDEGGVDKPTPFLLRNLPGFAQPDDPQAMAIMKRQRFIFELVPWYALPEQFRDNRQFPYNIGLGQRVRSLFARTFEHPVTEAGQPRDLLLRGRFTKAAPGLVQELDLWRTQQKRRASAGDVERRVQEWVQKAIPAYANQLRAKTATEREEAGRAVAELWREDVAEPVYALLFGAVARPRIPELIYELGLCKQEQAERLQARLDLAGKSAGAAEAEKAQTTWRDALNWWKEYTEQHPGAPAHPAARRWRGRAQAMLGDPKAAVASWQDLSGPMTELEKIASLYRARQLAPAQP